MKRQIPVSIKAHLLRGAFYPLLLIAVCLIPFALGQRTTGKQRKLAEKALGESQPLTLFGNAQVPDPTCTPSYTFALGGTPFVSGVTDIGNHCDNCGTAITLPFPVSLYGTTFTTATAGSNGYFAFGTPYNFFYSGCLPNANFTYTIFPFAVDQITGAPGNYGIFTITTGT